MMSPKLQRLLADRDLVEIPAPDDEVAGFWKKALRAYRDSLLPGLSPAGAFNAAYESALDAATALVRAAGYRVKASSRHHWATFYAVQGIGDEALEDFAYELDAVRGQRHENVYEADEDEDLAERRRDGLHAILAGFLPAARDWLVFHRPALLDRLPER
jgi:hypothetical protein